MTQPVPMLDLTQEVDDLWQELNAAIHDVLRSGQFIMGEAVQTFEQELAAYLGVEHAIALNSGTDALLIALRALGIGPGDEVLAPSFTFFATAEAISQVGATPVFVDIDPDSFNLDANLLESHITSRTKAMMPVHLYGQPANMEAILRIAQAHNLFVVEDVAQAMGATWQHTKVGTLGDIGCYSFFPTKNLGAYGDAGLIATDDPQYAETARKLRTHGSIIKYQNEILGYNSRMDSLQAAILRVKLPYLERWNRQRQAAAQRYTELLQGIAGITPPQNTAPQQATHVYHQYTIRIEGADRDALREHLKAQGIATMVYYPTPVHQLPVYRHLAVQLPVTERAAQQVLSLPMWPSITPQQQAQVVDGLKRGLQEQAPPVQP